MQCLAEKGLHQAKLHGTNALSNLPQPGPLKPLPTARKGFLRGWVLAWGNGFSVSGAPLTTSLFAV